MKITRITANGERKEALLKEYFLTASLLALFRRVSEQAANPGSGKSWQEAQAPALAKIPRSRR